MNSAIQIRLLRAIANCLRPMARVMLRSGIGYRQFAEMAKVAFVQEALGDKDVRGRMTNLSRVAIRTGLSRKEVSRLRARVEELARATRSAQEVDYHSGHAARVLQLWHADARFLDSGGFPKELSFAAPGVSFSTIVRAAGGDVPPGAVRAELLEANAIVELGNGALKPTKRYFVPANVGEELIVGFTHIVLPVLEGLARNTDDQCQLPFIQRLAYSDRLLPAALPLFREIARDRASGFVQSVDDWLSSNELSSEADVDRQYRVGLGVFYYEGVPSDPTGQPDLTAEDQIC
jgi:hypothetical protein